MPHPMEGCPSRETNHPSKAKDMGGEPHSRDVKPSKAIHPNNMGSLGKGLDKVQE